VAAEHRNSVIKCSHLPINSTGNDRSTEAIIVEGDKLIAHEKFIKWNVRQAESFVCRCDRDD